MSVSDIMPVDALRLEKLKTLFQSVEIRRRHWFGRLDEDRLMLCCAVGHVYADLVFQGVHFDDTKRDNRKVMIASLVEHARENTSWLWWIRERLAAMNAGTNEVHHLSPSHPYVDEHVDENDIGWPGARAVIRAGSDAISVTYGVGGKHGVEEAWFPEAWTTVDRNLGFKKTVAAQAFCACLRAHAATLERSTVNVRSTIYSVVESLCTGWHTGREVFRPDEQMAWVMFLNRMRK